MADSWLSICQSKFHDWKQRYGKRNVFTAASRASPGTPISPEDAIRIVGNYVEHYNEVRLHSTIGYIAPADKLASRETEIFAARDRKLSEARQRKKE